MRGDPGDSKGVWLAEAGDQPVSQLDVVVAVAASRPWAACEVDSV